MSSDNLTAITLRELKQLQASAWERLATLGHFERQLAEGAEADYRANCDELIGFCRQVLNGQLDLCRSSIALAEAQAGRDESNRQAERAIVEAVNVLEQVSAAAIIAASLQDGPGQPPAG